MLKLKNSLRVCLRIALGGVLFYAGFSKITSAWQFAETIANFRLFPAVANQILALVLPWYELCAGLLLILGLWTRASAVLALVLFSSFALAVASALARGLDVRCGCFGTDSASKVGAIALAIDLCGMAGAIVLARGRDA